ncbi:MAG: CHRD domain-containing protein [Gloeocapsa sp. DLM2.Bin57]|nr:MAG: CHRD domain-containing protein [Gloeocapsa sp. DLM2.Bin57]
MSLITEVEVLNNPESTPDSIRFMTFNSALSDRRTEEGQLIEILQETDYELAQNNAAIIQYLRPEILLLQEFDYDPNGEGISLFQQNYLEIPQQVDGFNLDPIEYNYVYIPPTNTGELASVDLNNDGQIALPNDAYGFGNFPGQYGMVVLSQYPIEQDNVRTFQEFLWKDMPGGYLETNIGAEGTTPLTEYFSAEAIDVLRLSSKNHIDVPINVNGETIHVLASHPTPPVFDGAEKRNLKRNNDEIRLWADYISGGDRAEYIYDDQGNVGGLAAGARFIIMGDQNADPVDGDSDKGDPSLGRGAINQILTHPNVNTSVTPFAAGGVEAAYLQKDSNPEVYNQQGNPGHDTSGFDLRVDYVLPSDNLDIKSSGIFYPDTQDPLNRDIFLPEGTFETDQARDGYDNRVSDHHAVFVDISLGNNSDDVFRVNLFHQSDQEGFAAAPQDANRNAAVMNRLRSLNDDPTLFINSGDLWIAGLYLDASEAIFGLKGSGQVMINNYLNWQTVTWGNHEFDIPTDEVAQAITANPDLSIGLNNVFVPVEEDYITSANGRTDNSFTVAVEETENGEETVRTLRIHGNVADLSSPLYEVADLGSIHLHNAADGGAVVAPLEVNATEDRLSAYFTGVITLTEELEEALNNGELYVNVHSENYQSGEVKSVLNLDRTYPGTFFPYMSSNMDFAADPYLGPLQVEGMRSAQGLGNQTTMDPLYIDVGGETFAVVAATTPTMPSLASNSVANGGIVTPENWVADEQGYDDLAALIQEQIDRAIAGPDNILGTEDDVNKVIVATHMQRINIDIDELVPRLKDVDVYIAGGSNTIFQNRANPLYPGDEYQIESYPLLLENADGLPTAVVNTDMNHEYLGYLQLEFNSDGVIVNDFNGDGQYNFGTDLDFDISVSRAYPGDISQVEALNATNLYDSRIDNLATALSNQMNDKDSRWYGITDEFLNGQRLGGDFDGVRNQETNLANLIHDSYIWYSRFWDEDVVISMSNGSGIRASIGQILPDNSRTPNDANEAVGKPAGGISQADIESALAFNNSIALIDITGEELKIALESINGLGNGDGDNGAYQVGGFAYSFDPDQPEGMRVRNARFLNEDGSLGDFIIQDGEVMTGAQVFRMATLGFNASRIFSFIENQNRVNLDPNDPQNSTGGVIAETPADLPNNAPVFGNGSQQDSLAEYLYQFSRMGTDDPSDDVPLGTPDTLREEDTRIQILSYREDSLASDSPVEPPISELPQNVFGTDGDDRFDSVLPGEKMFVGAGQNLFTGAGNDVVDITLANGGNRIDLGSGDDLIFAGNGDRLIAGSGNDILFLGNGQGNNVVTGGPGADQFWLVTDSEDIPPMAQTITDFTPGEDVIGLATTDFSFEDLNITQSGSNTVVSLTPANQDLAILLNTQVSELTESSFVFA